LNSSGKKCVKNEKIMWTKIFVALASGFVLLFMNFSLLHLINDDFNDKIRVFRRKPNRWKMSLTNLH